MKKIVALSGLVIVLTFSIYRVISARSHAYENNYLIVADTLTREISIARNAFYFKDSTNTLSVTQVKNAHWTRFHKIPTFQPSNNTHWFKLLIKNPKNTPVQKVLYIPYNSIYSIEVYQETNDTLKQIIQTGIKYPVENKKFNISGFPVSLNFKAGETSVVYVKFKHVYRPLRTTMYLLSKKRFAEILYHSQSLLWLWRGLYLFAIIISGIAWFFLKQNSFLYYALLNLGVSLYVFSHIGEIPIILGSDPTDFSSSVDYMGAFLINLSLPLFINSLTPIKVNNKFLWKVMIGLVYGIIPFVFLSFIPAVRLNFLTLIVHNYIMIVSGIVLLFQVYFLVGSTIYKRENALVLLIIYTIYILFSFVDIILPNMGVFEDNDYICKRFFIGSFIEVFSFMFLMSKQTLKVYNERTKLRDRQKNHQKELLFSIVKSQETERIRTGRELHDLIGANMAIIKHKINNQDSELNKIITQTIDSIRNLSHGLVVTDIDDNEFKDEIKELCYTASTETLKFHVYFHNWPKIENTDITTHLYRITQEFIQNALKHSQATDAYLQFIGEENQKAIVMYEDNGIGFNIYSEPNTKGLGLKNIKNRVSLLNGSFNIDSKLNGSGTSALIELNFR